MGIPGQLEHERVVAAIDTVVAACQKHGKWPGLGGVYGKELAKRYIGRGMRFILAGNDLGLLLERGAGAGDVRARLLVSASIQRRRAEGDKGTCMTS